MSLKQSLKRWLWARKKVKVMPGTIINGDTDIGAYGYIGYNCLISSTKIGRYVSIANNVNIGHGEHPINRISTNALFYANAKILTELDLIIEDDVWIGTGAIILRGVKIGRGAIVGAGCVVTKDIPPYSIAVGVPAKVIKNRFDPLKISEIEKSKWWEKDINEAKNIIVGLSDE